MNQTMTELSPRLPGNSHRDSSRREGSIYKSRETQNSIGRMKNNISLNKILGDRRSKPNLRESIEHGGAALLNSFDSYEDNQNHVLIENNANQESTTRLNQPASLLAILASKKD